MTPTLVDIARETKTSVSTVSRVLSGGEVAQRISHETRQRVMEVANRMGYRPNLLARSLRTRKSYSVALLLPDISHGRYAKITQLVETALREHGYSLMLCNSGTDDQLEEEYLDMIPRKGVDGLIVVPHDAPSGRLAAIMASQVAVVVLDRAIEGLPCVFSDFSQGSEALAQALEQTGVEKIALIAGSPHKTRDSLIEHAIAARLDIVERIDVAGDNGTAKLQPDAIDKAFDAVVCTSSRIAELYLSSRKEIDIAHPIATVDASDSLMSMPVPIMTCNQDIAELANCVVERLLPQLRGGTLDQTHVNLPMKVRTNRAMAIG